MHLLENLSIRVLLHCYVTCYRDLWSVLSIREERPLCRNPTLPNPELSCRACRRIAYSLWITTPKGEDTLLFISHLEDTLNTSHIWAKREKKNNPDYIYRHMFQFISQIHCGLPRIWNSLLCPWISLMRNLIKTYFIQWLYWPFRPPLVQTFTEKEDVTAAYLIQPPIFSQPEGRQHWVMDTGKSQTCKWKTEVSGAVPHSDHHGAAQWWLRQKRIGGQCRPVLVTGMGMRTGKRLSLLLL